MNQSITKLADAVAVEKPRSAVTVLGNTKSDKFYHWQKAVGGYKVAWPGGLIHLTIGDNKWMIKAKISDTFYGGERLSLEAAFKTADKLMYEHARDIWLKCSASTVLREFQGDLTTL